MGKVLIGIISYFPEDEERRAFRKAAHEKQLAWINEYIPNADILVVAQGYHEDDYYDKLYPNIRYHKFEKPLGICKVRNVLLEGFYTSEYDYLVITDDDCVLQDRFGLREFIDEFWNHPEKFFEVDAFASLQPRWLPFKDPIASDSQMINTHFKFVRTGSNNIHWFFLKNLKKYYDKEVYFVEGIDTAHGEGYEDLIFCYDLILAGVRYYLNSTLLLKVENMQGEKSTIFESTAEREKYHVKSMQEVSRRYIKYGAKFVNGKWDLREFHKNFNKGQPRLYIRRDKPIDVFKDLEPEYAAIYKSAKKKLF